MDGVVGEPSAAQLAAATEGRHPDLFEARSREVCLRGFEGFVPFRILGSGFQGSAVWGFKSSGFCWLCAVQSFGFRVSGSSDFRGLVQVSFCAGFGVQDGVASATPGWRCWA